MKVRILKESVKRQVVELPKDRLPMFTFPNGDYVYIEMDNDNGKLYAGSATNNGLLKEYEIDYDYDDSLDRNLEHLYDMIIEERPELLDESLNEFIDDSDTTKRNIDKKFGKGASKYIDDFCNYVEDNYSEEEFNNITGSKNKNGYKGGSIYTALMNNNEHVYKMFGDWYKQNKLGESLKEDKTSYGDTTIEDYVNANFSGDADSKKKFISAMKKKANGKDYFNGLNMSVKDWEKAGQKFGLFMKKRPVTESNSSRGDNNGKSYKLRFYKTKKGIDQGNLDHEEFFDTKEEAVSRYKQVFDRKNYALNPTVWVGNGDDWKRLSEIEINESLKEDKTINRYSDAYDDETRKKGWWYFTTHGVQPGSIPKGVNVLEIQDGRNSKGTLGTFVRLDGTLNTSELKRYDLVELSPDSQSYEDDYEPRLTTDDRNAGQWYESLNRKKRGLTEAMEKPYFRAFITNLGKYNEGELVGDWVDFPIDEDEFEEKLAEIGIGSEDEFGSPYEEWFVTDYECNLDAFEWEELGEYPSYETLQEFGELVDSIDDVVAVNNAYEVTDDLREAIEGLENGDIIFYPGLNSWEDLAYYIIDDVYGGVENLDPSVQEQFFDYEALGRDLGFDTYESEDEDGNEIYLSAGEYWCGDENATDYEIGEACVDQLGFDGVGDISRYFDYESYGRDFQYDNFTITSDGIIEYR